MTSTSVSVARTTSLSRSPSRVRGLWKPGVSTRISWASGRCTMPRTACRVVCGFDDVITIFWPTSAFVSVDLPAFGRPTKQAKPALKFSGVDDIADLSGAKGNYYGNVGAGEVPYDAHIGGFGLGDHRGRLETLHPGRERHRHRQLQGSQLDRVERDRASGVRPTVGVPYGGALGGPGPRTGSAGERDEFGVLSGEV